GGSARPGGSADARAGIFAGRKSGESRACQSVRPEGHGRNYEDEGTTAATGLHRRAVEAVHRQQRPARQQLSGIRSQPQTVASTNWATKCCGFKSSPVARFNIVFQWYRAPGWKIFSTK